MSMHFSQKAVTRVVSLRGQWVMATASVSVPVTGSPPQVSHKGHTGSPEATEEVGTVFPVCLGAHMHQAAGSTGAIPQLGLLKLGPENVLHHLCVVNSAVPIRFVQV